MTPDKKKSGLSMMLAMPQGEEAAPSGNEMEEAPVAEPMENSLMVPKGFKIPSGSRDGEPFTTTVRGKIVDGKLMVEALGDVPMHSEQGETTEEEMSESPEEQGAEPEEQAMEPEDQPPGYEQEAKMMKKKRADEMAARKVFQPGR